MVEERAQPLRLGPPGPQSFSPTYFTSLSLSFRICKMGKEVEPGSSWGGGKDYINAEAYVKPSCRTQLRMETRVTTVSLQCCH